MPQCEERTCNIYHCDELEIYEDEDEEEYEGQTGVIAGVSVFGAFAVFFFRLE